MEKIKILNDQDGDYGYHIGTIISVDELFKDFRNSQDCTDSLYDDLCKIPIPYAVDEIAARWGLDYEFVQMLNLC